MVAGCLDEADGRSVADLERRRDEFLAELLLLVERFGVGPPVQQEARSLLTLPMDDP
jgi:hypothetical protein